MRSLRKLLGDRDEAPCPEKAAAPDISPPVIDSERAEEEIFEDAKKKNTVISGIRTHLGDKK
ncbi:hypothetical protein [Methanocella sp.]|uniref:hypothetical protein n=1 Tax=Methanocella sp. TaxID=2052833 RepID=UPI002D7F9591|nr:hypothetical protein [Methanocella sp.]